MRFISLLIPFIHAFTVRDVMAQLPNQRPMTVQQFSQQLIQLQSALIQVQTTSVNRGRDIAKMAAKEELSALSKTMASWLESNDARLEALTQNMTEVSALLLKQMEEMSELSTRMEQLRNMSLQSPGFYHYPARANFVSTGFSNSWYRLVNEAKEWHEAERYCVELFPKAHLAMVTSAEENSFIKDFIENRVKGSRGMVYLGGRDLKTEGEWRWWNGQAIAYTNWSQNEPNNSGGSEDCVELSSSNGQWNDVTCTVESPFICQVFYPE